MHALDLVVVVEGYSRQPADYTTAVAVVDIHTELFELWEVLKWGSKHAEVPASLPGIEDCLVCAINGERYNK